MDLPPPQVVCIAQIVYAEARGESELGQRAVAHVVLNRSAKFNKKPCIIVRQPGQFQVKFQKSYKGKAWDKAYKYALNSGRDPTGGALYFKASKSVTWLGKKLTTIIGNHQFYK